MPIRNLNENAEQFDVSFKIDDRVHYYDRGTHHSTYLQQQPLLPQADLLRAFINSADNHDRLAETKIYLPWHIKLDL